jgi:hypothetical protein
VISCIYTPTEEDPMTHRTQTPNDKATDTRYLVTVKVAGVEDWTTEVVAPREGLAQTRSLRGYFDTHPDFVSGSQIDFVVKEV